MYVKPTLFIGVGTTGTEIIKQLRRYIFEEFQVAALPCFSYITLETNVKNKGIDPQLPDLDTMQPEEKIQMVPIGIPDVQEFRSSLNEPRKHRDYGDLQRWLSPGLLNTSPQNFQDGAGNTRMVGRLCLWYNWEQVSGAIQSAYNRITAPDASARTTQLLRAYLDHKGRANEDIRIGSTKDVYIVGTLCGGTCSGGFLDLGFYATYDLLGVGMQAALQDWRTEDQSSVYGIFTIVDRQAAQQNRVFAANCYAALTELDYYYHDQSNFSYVFPGQKKIDANNGEPFRWIELVSNSTSTAGINFHGSNGEQSLNGTIGLKIFTDVITPVLERKVAARSNYHTQVPRYSQLSTAGHVHRLNTFGTAAYWYPKSRIARGVAALLGQQFCSRFLNTVDYRGELLERDVRVAVEPIFQQALHKLLYDMELQIDLKTEISQILQTHKKDLLEAKDLESTLLRIPRDKPLPHEYKLDGRFSRLISDQIPEFRRQLKTTISTLWDRLSNRPIQYINQYFAEVHRYFQRWLEKSPTSAPTIQALRGIARLVDVLREVEDDWWLRQLGLPAKLKEQLMEQLLESAEREYHKKLEELRNFLIRNEIQEICRQIDPSGGQNLTDRMQNNLNECFQKFGEELKAAQKPTRNDNVEIIVSAKGKNLEESIRIEIDALYQRLQERLSEDGWRRIEQKSCQKPPIEGDGYYTLHDFLQKDETYIFNQLNSVLQREVLRDMRTINVTELVVDYANVTNDQLKRHLMRSDPFLEFGRPFANAPQPGFEVLPNLIASDTQENAQAVRNRLEDGQQIYQRTAGTGFEHLLIFYREQPMFSLEDMALHTNHQSFYLDIINNQVQGGMHSSGIHTDKDIARFDVTYFLHIDTLRNRFELAKELLSQEIFARDERGKLVFRYRNAFNIPFSCSAESFDEEFHTLAHGKHSNDREAFYGRMRDIFHELGHDKVHQRLQDYLEPLTTSLDFTQQQREFEKRITIIRNFLPGFGDAPPVALRFF